MNPPLTWQDGTTWSTGTTDGRFYAEERAGRWHLFSRHREIGMYASKADAQAAAERQGGAR